MRKLDWCRDLVNKALKSPDPESVIRYADVPDEFRNADDLDATICIPYEDSAGICGVTIVHTYEWNGELYVYHEDISIRKVVPVKC